MRLADAIADHAEEIAEIETRDNGKIYREMVAQLRVVPDWLYYFGGLADKSEGRVIPLDRQSVLNYTMREPLGVVGIIVPWNSPTLLTVMALAPALAAGNSVVVKPSEVTSVSILRIMELSEEIGFPPGILNVVTGQREAGEALVAHPKVAKITFTGSTATGRRIAAALGARLARYTLELGGKSANIVFKDASVDAAVAGVLAGIYAAAGQTCVAGSRALLEDEIFDEVLGRVVDRAKSIVIGDPMDPTVEMGPIATHQQLQKIVSFVEQAQTEGANVVCGGTRVQPIEGGFFYTPTVLDGVQSGNTVFQEEIFGPVLSVIRFRGEDEAISLANATNYGLAAGVWTSQIQRAHRMARALDAGTVWINTYRALTFNSPFGGYKDSGIGRENGIEALDEYLQTKSVWCELSEEVSDPFVLKV
jgi:acyl-CoA reductase-like NAD-dependent aldehyde dehydrogenase